MRGVLLLTLAAGCGRLEFDDVPDPCPAGYVHVRGDPQLGTRAFCVMQFEAKAKAPGGAIVDEGCDATCAPDGLAVADHQAVSVPHGRPWRSISGANAFSACAAVGEGHALIANREWMTIARAAERTAANWSAGAVGDGRLVEGKSAGVSPYWGVTDPDDPYSDTDGTWEQRRTIHLPDGAVVWDMPANAQEWIDWTIDTPILDGPPACTGGELPVVDCPGYAAEDYQSAAGTLDRTVGAGFVIGGMGDTGRRGGQSNDREMGLAGIYSLNMNRFSTQTFTGTGFRCVYRLTSPE